MSARHEWWCPATISIALALSGCVPAPEAVAPDAPMVDAAPPPVGEVRQFGPGACWRIDLPGVDATPERWPALCVPVAAARPCIETPTQLHCPDRPPPPKGTWQ